MRVRKKRKISAKYTKPSTSTTDDIAALKKKDLIKLAQNIASHLKEQYEVSLQDAVKKDDLIKLAQKIRSHLKERYDISLQDVLVPETLPLEIFAKKLSPSEAVVKYLKENLKLRFREIALMLNRDERSVWGSYNRAKKKMPSSFRIVKSVTRIPVSVLKDRRVAMLEAVVFYLKETEGIPLIEIARLLNKAPTTIYTAYSRARKKIGGDSVKKYPKSKQKGGGESR